jgi:hypothetical protein
MSVFWPGAFAGIFVASIALSTGATASPLGSAARDIGVPADSNVIQVQAKKGKPANVGAANTAPKSGGNRQGGGNRAASGGGGGRHTGRNAGAIAVGVGLVGGLIAAEQRQQTVEQDEYVEQAPRCPYGSYINRFGERRCRR